MSSSNTDDGGRPEDQPRDESDPPANLTLPATPEAGPVHPHDHAADEHDRRRYASTRLYGDYACSASLSRSRW